MFEIICDTKKKRQLKSLPQIIDPNFEMVDEFSSHPLIHLILLRLIHHDVSAI